MQTKKYQALLVQLRELEELLEEITTKFREVEQELYLLKVENGNLSKKIEISEENERISLKFEFENQALKEEIENLGKEK